MGLFLIILVGKIGIVRATCFSISEDWSLSFLITPMMILDVFGQEIQDRDDIFAKTLK